MYANSILRRCCRFGMTSCIVDRNRIQLVSIESKLAPYIRMFDKYSKHDHNLPR